MAIHGLDRIRPPLDYVENARNMPIAPIWVKRPRVVIGAAGLAAIAIGAFFITRAVLERDTHPDRHRSDGTGSQHRPRRRYKEWLPW
jgi:hypothetical protein